MPKRIKRSHYLEKLPPNSKAVHRVGRYGGRWGNPHTVKECGSNEEAVRRYRQDLLSGNLHTGKDGRYHITPEYVREHLKGFNLACTCDLDETCHADVLLEVANGDGWKIERTKELVLNLFQGTLIEEAGPERKEQGI